MRGWGSKCHLGAERKKGGPLDSRKAHQKEDKVQMRGVQSARMGGPLGIVARLTRKKTNVGIAFPYWKPSNTGEVSCDRPHNGSELLRGCLPDNCAAAGFATAAA